MYAKKMGPFIAPSITKGATIPSWRKPATKVIVFQCPCGTDATNRSPRKQRPLTRTMFVLETRHLRPDHARAQEGIRS
jgi:hypothetical protein